MALVLDTGPVLALMDADDPAHERCVGLVEGLDESLVVPAVLLGEVDYWCRKLLGLDVWEQFLDDLAGGAYRLYELDASGYRRAGELERRYANLDLGLVDAAVITVCEELAETKVATLDRRDFSLVQPRHCPALTLLPD
ncbi:MAG TPA: PIN domain-containing protein [Egibacteraceae bacterium]|nr:PIN domain-containing protein [Actinomycetota bacterium]HWB72383.1 PIN domain-containing protein [Egibacteraceae bacterium]